MGCERRSKLTCDRDISFCSDKQKVATRRVGREERAIGVSAGAEKRPSSFQLRLKDK